jgi:hypothetical protein
METAIKQKLIQEVLPYLQLKVSKLPPYDGTKKLMLRWPKRELAVGLAYDVVDVQGWEVFGYVHGNTTDDGNVAVFMLSSGEWMAGVSPKDRSEFEVIDNKSNCLHFYEVKRKWRGIYYESDAWILEHDYRQILLTHKPDGRCWKSHHSVEGDSSGEDLGSFIWPIDLEHGKALAGCLAFARMWLVSLDFD